MTTKIIEYLFECQNCGELQKVRRHLFIAELKDKIEIPEVICECGNNKKFKLLDVSILKEEI